MAVGCCGGEGFGVRDLLYRGEAGGNDLVGAVLYPLGGGGVGWAAIWRVVLEAAVFGRVVGRSDDDAVGEIVFALRVVGEDGVGECRGGSVGKAVVDHDFDVVSGEDFEGSGEGGFGERVGVLREEERASGRLLAGDSRRWLA